MTGQSFQRRLPGMAASVGLFWVLTLVSSEIERPLLSTVLVVALIFFAIASAKPEVVGVTVAATLALAAIGTSPSSFAAAGGSAVITLALLAAAERRFRWMSVGAAAAAVVVIAILGPMVVDSPTPAPSLSDDFLVASDPGDGLYFENRVESIQRPAVTSIIDPAPRLSDESVGDALAGSRQLQEVIGGEVQIEESGTSIWSYLLGILIAVFVLYLIKRSRVDVPLGSLSEDPKEPEDLAEQAEFVLAFEEIGERAGVVRETNESVLSFGNRLAGKTGNDDFSEAASMISERLYGKTGRIDPDELRAVLDSLQVAPETQ